MLITRLSGSFEAILYAYFEDCSGSKRSIYSAVVASLCMRIQAIYMRSCTVSTSEPLHSYVMNGSGGGESPQE